MVSLESKKLNHRVAYVVSDLWSHPVLGLVLGQVAQGFLGQEALNLVTSNLDLF